MSAAIEAACRKTLQHVSRDSGAQSPAQKIPYKTICHMKSLCCTVC